MTRPGDAVTLRDPEAVASPEGAGPAGHSATALSVGAMVAPEASYAEDMRLHARIAALVHEANARVFSG